MTDRARNLVEWLDPHIRLMDVRRIGFPLSGCYGEEAMVTASQPNGGFFENRQQSDLEHCAGCMYIVQGLRIFYPEMFASLDEDELKRYGNDRNRFELLTRMVGDHEVGEVPSGDIASDGTRDEAKKDAEESAYLNKIYVDSKAPTEERVLANFLFEDQQLLLTTLGCDGRSIDKTEPINYNLKLESCGHTGWTNAKPFITELDKAAYEITQDWRAADIWTCNAISNAPQLVLSRHAQFFFEFVMASAEKYRGPGAMSWLPGFVNKLEEQEKAKLKLPT